MASWKMDHVKMYFLLTIGIFHCHVGSPAGRLQAVILANLRFDPRQDAHLTPTTIPKWHSWLSHSTQTSVLSKDMEYQSWMATNRENLGHCLSVYLQSLPTYTQPDTYHVVTSPKLLEYPSNSTSFSSCNNPFEHEKQLGSGISSPTSLNPLA